LVPCCSPCHALPTYQHDEAGLTQPVEQTCSRAEGEKEGGREGGEGGGRHAKALSATTGNALPTHPLAEAGLTQSGRQEGRG
jgi:hypothetical protein